MQDLIIFVFRPDPGFSFKYTVQFKKIDQI